MIKLFIVIGLLLSIEANAEPLIRIAILDTGLNNQKQYKLCKSGHYDATTGKNEVGVDNIGHGTMIATILMRNIRYRNYCFVIYKYINIRADIQIIQNILTELKHIAKNKVDYMNYSSDGPVANQVEHDLLKEIIDNGTLVFISSGNDGKNLDKDCSTYPTCYKDLRIYRVGSRNVSYSNHGKIIDYVENGYYYIDGQLVTRGTSCAAPRALARVLNNRKR